MQHRVSKVAHALAGHDVPDDSPVVVDAFWLGIDCTGMGAYRYQTDDGIWRDAWVFCGHPVDEPTEPAVVSWTLH